MLNGSCECYIPYYTPAFIVTSQHSLVHPALTANIQCSQLYASIHCYHLAFPTTRQHSQLPFTISYYKAVFTASIQHSLLQASIHYYNSAFPTTRQHSQLQFSIPYYTPAFTATIQNSILHARIHCYHSAFPTTCQH